MMMLRRTAVVAPAPVPNIHDVSVQRREPQETRLPLHVWAEVLRYLPTSTLALQVRLGSRVLQQASSAALLQRALVLRQQGRSVTDRLWRATAHRIENIGRDVAAQRWEKLCQVGATVVFTAGLCALAGGSATLIGWWASATLQADGAEARTTAAGRAESQKQAPLWWSIAGALIAFGTLGVSAAGLLRLFVGPRGSHRLLTARSSVTPSRHVRKALHQSAVLHGVGEEEAQFILMLLHQGRVPVRRHNAAAQQEV